MASKHIMVTCPKGHKLVVIPVAVKSNGGPGSTGVSGLKTCNQCRREVKWVVHGFEADSEYQ